VLRVEADGLVYYRFDGLQSGSHLRHGIFTRLGGVSRPPWHSLNVGASVGDDPQAVHENHCRIYRTLALSGERRTTAYQVGGNRVARVSSADVGRIIPGTDALVTDVPGVPLVMRFADCLPLVLYDQIRGVAALVHAGWKGTVSHIAAATVRFMSAHFGTRPADIIAGVGPGIGPCCYEIGPDVIGLVRQNLPFPGLLETEGNGSVHFDLWEANRVLLAQAGVGQIEVAGLCTACHTDEWFSHRAEHGRTGRFAAVVALEET
jgi:hypothetical protein